MEFYISFLFFWITTFLLLNTLQIKREISTMKLVKHPNIVQIYEVHISLILFCWKWYLHIQIVRKWLFAFPNAFIVWSYVAFSHTSILSLTCVSWLLANVMTRVWLPIASGSMTQTHDAIIFCIIIFFLKLWADCYYIICTSHWELMKSVGRNDS